MATGRRRSSEKPKVSELDFLKHTSNHREFYGKLRLLGAEVRARRLATARFQALQYFAFCGACFLVACRHHAADDPVKEFLGDWQLRGGDEDKDCGSGPQTQRILGTHEVRIVEGESSDLSLQFFAGTGTDGAFVCEFQYDLSSTTAVLVGEQSCPDVIGVVTWHGGTADINDFGYLALDTHLTNGIGCTVNARPVYQRVP
jgi:hypothetical protein